VEKPLDDKYSYGILIILSEGESHFNQLWKTLNDRGLPISKPTLSSHLKRLVKDGYVKREEKEGTQLVGYTANLEKTFRIKEYWKRTKTIVKPCEENKQKFLSIPESKQVSIVLELWLRKKLNEIKANVNFRLDRENLDKEMALLFLTSPLLDFAEHWLVQKCTEDEEYKKRIFREIDGLLKRTKGE
jgi:DNA-binding PadR family transcriptional regulator